MGPTRASTLANRITEAEFIEMRTHGPKIREELTALLIGLRRDNDRATNRSAG